MQGNLLCMMHFPFGVHKHHPEFVEWVEIDGNLVNRCPAVAVVHNVEEDNGYD